MDTLTIWKSPILSQGEYHLKAKEIINELSKKFIEREELSSLMFLTFCARVHIYLTGMPGVGKTDIITTSVKMIAPENSKIEQNLQQEHQINLEDLQYELSSDETVLNDLEVDKLICLYESINDNIAQMVVQNLKKYKLRQKPGLYFEKTLDTETTKEELFGASAESFDLIDKTETILGNRIFFADEVPRSKVQLQETMLSVMNERKYQWKGVPYPVPLHTMIGASNSLITGERAAAFSDRFLMKYEVIPIQNPANFKKFIQKEFDQDREMKNKLTYKQLYTIYEQSKLIRSHPDGDNIYYKLKQRMRENGINITDRKILATVGILATSAFLNNRREIDYSDYFILSHICWDTYQDIQKIRIILYEFFFQNKDNIDRLFNEADDAKSHVFGLVNNYLDKYLKYDFVVGDFTSKVEMEFLSVITTTANSILVKLHEVYLKYEDIKRLKLSADTVASQIENNLFIYNVTDQTFTSNVIERFEKNLETIDDVYNLITDWMEENSDFYSFQLNCSRFARTS